MYACADMTAFDRIALKCDPDEALVLRERHAEITPAFHFSKTHWNDVRTTGDLPDAFVRRQIRSSYLLALAGVTPRSVRDELRAHIRKSGTALSEEQSRLHRKAKTNVFIRPTAVRAMPEPAERTTVEKRTRSAAQPRRSEPFPGQNTRNSSAGCDTRIVNDSPTASLSVPTHQSRSRSGSAYLRPSPRSASRDRTRKTTPAAPHGSRSASCRPPGDRTLRGQSPCAPPAPSAA